MPSRSFYNIASIFSVTDARICSRKTYSSVCARLGTGGSGGVCRGGSLSVPFCFFFPFDIFITSSAIFSHREGAYSNIFCRIPPFLKSGV